MANSSPSPRPSPTPDGGADERWSFARRCVQAGYALQWEHIERKGVTYERASAELDALAARLADEPSRAAVRDEPAAGTPRRYEVRQQGREWRLIDHATGPDAPIAWFINRSEAEVFAAWLDTVGEPA